MCGILGEFSFNGIQTEKSRFLEILSLSKNRGPDNSGYYSNDKNFQAGFNRLSVLDLSKHGNQPITSHSGRYVMVYNGEVYNYKNIKDDLLIKGYNFLSTGDSEVIINAFEEYGIENTIGRLDGMFSIGLFDKKSEDLYLIRDFAGIKPLFYGFDNQKLVFASQYDQVVSHPNFIDNNIDPSVLKLYLTQHFIPAPFGIIKKTFQVKPGEYIIFNKTGIKRKNRYWKLSNEFDSLIHDESKALSIINDALNSSVKSQLISDVPVGAFLSGGTDSPLICHYANKILDGKLMAFTIGSDSAVHDETSISREYSKLLGLNQIVEKLNSRKVVDVFSEISSSITEPFADFSIIPTFIVSKIAKKNITVALSGDGGDELFFGYERFWSIAKNLNIQNFPYFIKYILYGFDKILFNNRNFNSACLFANQGMAHFHLNSRFINKDLNEIAPYLKNIFLPEGYSVYDYPKQKNQLNLLNHMRIAEFYGMMQKTLRKVDLASMANGLEVRLPFLKKSFIETSLMVSPFLSYGPNKGRLSRQKVLLKSLLKKNISKSPIANIKRGFSIPLTQWLKHDLKDYFNDILMEKNCIEYFCMNKNSIESLMRNHLESKTDNKWPLFTLYSLFNWKNNLKK
tara:strand:+ start:1175 stop:3049 length:1875 start_codon:yes stop_codon:yes gene_type:complete